MAESAGRTRPLVIGIGTEERSDDGIGLDVARSLRDRPSLGADVVEGPGDLLRLLEEWDGRRYVVLVDGMRSGAPPGTVQRWDQTQLGEFPATPAVSTHGFGLGDVLRMAHDLGRLPPTLVIFGIEVKITAPGRQRSAACRAAIDRVGDWIAWELAERAGAGADA